MSSSPLGITKEREMAKNVDWIVGSLFPLHAEGQLWRAVFMQAVEDAIGYAVGQRNKFFAADAVAYLLTPEIPACEVCGVDSDYARRVIKQVGIF